MCVGVKRLAKMGMVESAPGMSALDMNTAEDMVVRNTREVVPGMIICGMEVSHFSLPVANLADVRACETDSTSISDCKFCQFWNRPAGVFSVVNTPLVLLTASVGLYAWSILQAS